MTIEQMQKRKEELGYSYARIAQLSGVPAATVQKVMTGRTKSPRYDTLHALQAVLNSDKDIFFYRPQNEKKQGEFTLEDYYALPDEQRVELIDGVFYDMSAPASVHQLLAGYIYADLLSYVRGKQGGCLPLISPFDVQLDKDDHTMVQPDVMIVCDRSKIIRRCVFGAPDLVIEIISPSTRRKDITLKLMKYANAGVREYWIIWPKEQKVVVYDLEHDAPPVIYGFNSRIPVGIWNGEHYVDLEQILQDILFIYELEEEEPR